MKKNILALFNAILIAVVSPAWGGLIGNTVSICADSVYTGTVSADPSSCDLGTAQPSPTSALVIDPGVEFTLMGRAIDLADSTIMLSYAGVSSASPDLYVFSDILPSISGLTLLTSNPLGITTAFTNHTIGLLVSNPRVDGTVTFRIQFSQIPEPSILALMSFGFVGLGFCRGKHKRGVGRVSAA